ncbi:MAG: AmmeMemoRadiSam system protein B [bacterium]
MKGLKIIFIIFLFFRQVAAQEMVRQPARAGQFYPGSAVELRKTIDNYLDKSTQCTTSGEIKGLWVPHAGYQFSGQIAANGYSCLKNSKFDLVILIGPSHYYRLSGASIGNWSGYKTPLGLALIDTVIANKLRSECSLIHCINDAHNNEHSLEVQVPFLQTVLPGVPIIPVLTGFNVSYRDCEEIATAIVDICRNKKILIIASSDMSHFPDYSNACAVDKKMLEVIQSFNPEKVLNTNKTILRQNIPSLDCTLCGLNALVTMMLAVKKINADTVKILSYANSGDVLENRERVVGYGAGIFYEKIDNPIKKKGRIMDEIKFSREEEKKLFTIARKSVIHALENKEPPTFLIEEENLKEKRGVFVTLMNSGRLRGCIGYFEAEKPLYSIVSQMAAAAATQDYRFAYNPVRVQEMDEISIKISILSRLKKIDSIDEIEIGKHGIWIKQGMRGGTYLPEVATEMGWNKIEFLEHCCVEKAGLSRDAWKKDADIYIYSSQILDEKDLS